MSFLRSGNCLPEPLCLPCNINISVLVLLIVLSSLEAFLLLRNPLPLGMRAATIGGAGRIGSGLLRSALLHLDVRRELERDRWGCAVIVVVKVLRARLADDWWGFGVRVIFALTGRVVVSETERVGVGG